MVVACWLSSGMYFPNISRRSSEEARLCRRLTLLPVPESRDRGDDEDDDDRAPVGLFRRMALSSLLLPLLLPSSLLAAVTSLPTAG